MDPSQIQGLPPGATVTPIQSATPPAIQGLPPGATVTPIQQPAAAAAAAAAPAQTPPPPDDDGIFDVAGMKRRMTLHNMGQRIAGLNEGIGRHFDEGALTLEQIARKVPHVGDYLGAHGLDAQIAHDQQVVNAPAPTDTERAGGQDIGKQTASILEFMAGEGALSKMGFAAKMEELAPFAKALKKSPALTRVISNALQQGTVGAGQTLLHGGSATDALASGGAQAATGAVLEGGPEALHALAESVKPTTRTIAGQEIPTLRSQDANASATARSAASIPTEPTYQADQQQRGQAAIGDVARDALKGTLDRVNGRRGGPETEPTRMLPAPEDMKPYQFTLEGGGDIEANDPRTGSSAFDPRKRQVGTRVVEGKGPAGKPGLQPRVQPAFEQEPYPVENIGMAADPQERQGSHKQTLFQYLTDTKTGQTPGVNEATTKGGGTFTTDDPAVARQHLSELQSIAESSSFDSLSPRAQQRISGRIDDLSQQLEEHGAWQARMSHFPKIDTASVAGKVNSFDDAGEQAIGSVQDVFSKMDQVSDDTFGTLRRQQRAARKVLRESTTDAADKAAQQRLDEINGKINDIFEQSKTQIHPVELQAAQGAYKDGQTYFAIHDALQKSFNGVPDSVVKATAGDAAPIERTLKGGTKMYRSLQGLLDGPRGADVQRLLGDEGVTHLYRVSKLLENPATAAPTKSLLGQVGMVLRRHSLGLGVGAATGAVLSHGIGGFGYLGGAMTGAITEAAYRRAVNRMATDPAVAKRIEFAVKNNVSHRIAAPLVANMMMQAQQPDTTQPDGGQQ